MTLTLQDVLNEAVKTASFVSLRNSRLLTALCEEIASQLKALLLHTEVKMVDSGQSSGPTQRNGVMLYLSEFPFKMSSLLSDAEQLQASVLSG